MIERIYRPCVFLIAVLGATGAMAQSYKQRIPETWCENVKQQRTLEEYRQCMRLRQATNDYCVADANSEKDRNDCIERTKVHWVWSPALPGPNR